MCELLPDKFPEEVQQKLAAIDERLDHLTVGVNAIGEMMNQASEGLNSLFQQFASGGGIMGLLGALKGGGKNG